MGLGTIPPEKILANYTGCTALSFLCEITNLSIDQINFITCQTFALCCSFFMKKYVKDPPTRLIYSLVLGFGICFWCFGRQILHIITSAGVGYLIIRFNTSPSMPWISLCAAMTYLSMCHLQRQFFDELGSYTLDITGPMMILTEKVTSLAFSLQDAKNAKAGKPTVTEMQRKYAVDEKPTLLEYWSYIFQFQCMLAGPFVLFKDFREFIHTTEYPSPTSAVCRKIAGSVFFAAVFVKVTPLYGVRHLKDADFLWKTTFLSRLFYITIATLMERAKYYHAWILADAVCNASGLGYDKKKNSWDLVTNVDAIGFESGLNLRESLECWNRGTMTWLRHIVYERASPKIRTVATFAMSAIWHGFFPGYYMTFLTGALFTSAARQIRKTIRPLFLNHKGYKCAYDFVTWITTRLAIAYVTFSFVLLHFTPSIIIYLRLYFCFHLAGFGVVFALPKLSKRFVKSANREAADNLITSEKLTTDQVVKTQIDRAANIQVTELIMKSAVVKRQVDSSAKESGDMLNDNQPDIKKDDNVNHLEFPEIKQFLNGNKYAWSDWNNSTLNRVNSPVKLKTG